MDDWMPPARVVAPAPPVRCTRLVTPPNGTILNPFLGSGSAAVAAKLEGMNMYAFDTDADYVRFARARVAATESET
jgi:DNA modification methylase